MTHKVYLHLLSGIRYYETRDIYSTTKHKYASQYCNQRMYGPTITFRLLYNTYQLQIKRLWIYKCTIEDFQQRTICAACHAHPGYNRRLGTIRRLTYIFTKMENMFHSLALELALMTTVPCVP